MSVSLLLRRFWHRLVLCPLLERHEEFAVNQTRWVCPWCRTGGVRPRVDEK